MDVCGCVWMRALLALAVQAASVGAADRTVPAAYSAATRRDRDEAELLSEGLFNTLLLSIRGAFDCQQAEHRRDKHTTPTESPLNTPEGSATRNSPALKPLMFPLQRDVQE